MSNTEEDPRIAAMVERMNSFNKKDLPETWQKMLILLLAAADAVDPLRQQRDPDEGSKPNFPIKAEVFSDDLKLSVKFDAGLYFAAAENQDILNLADCEFRGDTAADDVARYMSKLPGHSDIQAVLFYADEVPDMGFECYMDLHDALEWIKHNRQDVLADVMDILEDNRTIRVVETSHELRAWFYSLPIAIKHSYNLHMLRSDAGRGLRVDRVFVGTSTIIVATSNNRFYVRPNGHPQTDNHGAYTLTGEDALTLALTWSGSTTTDNIPICDNPPVYSTTR